MSLGLCCHWLELDSKDRYHNIIKLRALQLGRYRAGKYSDDFIAQVYLDNANSLLNGLRIIAESGIRNYRMGSGMFPLHDLVERNLWDNPEIREILRQAGDLALSQDIRLTMHPDQYCVLNSDENSKIANAVSILEIHGWQMDQMGLPLTPYYSMNIHGGKRDRSQALIENIQSLPDNIRLRLTLENCEFAYSVKDLLPVSIETGVPICFDSHHHVFNTGGLSQEMALETSMGTWGEHKPLTHLSNTKEGVPADAPRTKLRQHSDFIYTIPEKQFEMHEAGLIDIDIEAKKKNFAIFDMVEKLGVTL